MDEDNITSLRSDISTFDESIINTKDEPIVEFEETQIKSEIENDLDNGCIEFVTVEHKSDRSTDEFRIELKPIMEFDEMKIKSEFSDTESGIPATSDSTQRDDGNTIIPTTSSSFNIKSEEMEFPEVTISGYNCAVPGQPIGHLKTEIPEDGVQLEKFEKRNEEIEFTQTTISGSNCIVSDPPNMEVLNKETELVYKCTLCDFSATGNSYLTKHMGKHTGEKPFKCHICEYASAHRYRLTQHNMRKHKEDKPFKCSICGYASAQSYEFQLHMRIHTGEKPFKCTICDYASARSSHLKVHIRTHTREAI